MFLLILRGAYTNVKTSNFTFHYVSINTTCITFLYLVGFAFTFHYVFINTTYRWDGLMENHLSLHSTMFLLIPDNDTIVLVFSFNFTFHYVSINTDSFFTSSTFPTTFTFHYVSINTRFDHQSRTNEIKLYIPLCFY